MQRYELQGAFADTVTEVAKIVNAFNPDKDFDLDDLAGATQATTALLGVGIPVQRVTRSLQNLAEGDISGAIFSQNPDRN